MPPGRAVTSYWEWPIGIVSRDGGSLACVVPGRGRRLITALAEHGDARAGDELAHRIDVWLERGRPGPRELKLVVDYRGGEPRVSRRFVTPS